jgi:site-specific recombinase XerD
MAALHRDTQLLLTAGLSASTRAGYGQNIHRWLTFCASLPVPVDPLRAPETVWALFATQLAREGLQKDTVAKYITAIRAFYADNATPVPDHTGYLQRVVKGIARNPIHAQRRPKKPERLPLTISVLARLRRVLTMTSYDHCLLWIVSLVGVYGLLRAGEITDVRGKLPSAERERRTVRMSHVTILNQGATLQLHVPVTKTSQINGMFVYYARNNALPDICPIRAFFTFMEKRRALHLSARAQSPDSPLFLTTEGVTLARRDYVNMLRHALRASGITDIEIPRFTGHSLRRGGAQSLLDAGMTIDQIKIVGHWKSDAVKRYFSTYEAMATSFTSFFTRAAAIPPGHTSAATYESSDSDNETRHSDTAARSVKKPSSQPTGAQRQLMVPSEATATFTSNATSSGSLVTPAAGKKKLTQDSHRPKAEQTIGGPVMVVPTVSAASQPRTPASLSEARAPRPSSIWALRGPTSI